MSAPPALPLLARFLSLRIPIAAALAVLCPGGSGARGESPVAERVYQRAVVAADHPAASEVGLALLKQGGNVVDAAVGTAFALGVVRPASSGLGGGGFLLYWNARDQTLAVYDYRERAPAAARADQYASSTAATTPPAASADRSSVYGGLAVAVPGQVAGLCQVLSDHGRLNLRTVLAPVQALVRDGVPIDEHDREVQAETLADFAAHPGFRERFAPLWKRYLNAGEPWPREARFHSPLGEVLEQIAAQGPGGFHAGPVAEAIVAEVTRQGGNLSLADLASQKPVRRTALSRSLGTGTLFTMPPPSSGGVALIETLNILDAAEPKFPAPLTRQSPGWLHLLGESLQHAFADRAEYLGDTDFVQVPLARLLSPRYAAALAERVDPARTGPAEAYGRFQLPDDAGTTHFSIIDAEGNAVACTETINTAFGSFVVEPKYGIVLNNEMDDFTARPGEPNAFGLLQSRHNGVAPGKKPLSSMTPTIVVRDGRAEFVVGASGGPRIITATLQVLLNMQRFGLTPQGAIEAPRVHHQWMPHRLELEPGFPAEVAEELERRGHAVNRRGESGVVQATARGPDGLRGGSDPRKHGRPAGH
ncbi:MAG: gamma-glutamyltransferase [Planctomycetaceae bacterium]